LIGKSIEQLYIIQYGINKDFILGKIHKNQKTIDKNKTVEQGKKEMKQEVNECENLATIEKLENLKEVKECENLATIEKRKTSRIFTKDPSKTFTLNTIKLISFGLKLKKIVREITKS